MRKKAVALGCALLLAFGAAAAEGIPERAALGPLMTETGFTTVTVDALVEAGGAAHAARWEVRPRAFTPEEAEKLLEACGFDAESLNLDPAPLPSGATTYRGYTEAKVSRAADGRSLDLWNGYVDGEPALARAILKEGRTGAASAQYMTLLPMAEADENACSLTFEAASSRALALAAQIAPEMELRAAGFTTDVTAYSQALAAQGDGLVPLEGAAAPDGYGFVFTRTVDGLPVTAAWEEYLPNPHGGEKPPVAYEKLRVLIRENGALIACYTPCEVVAGTREEVALLPFETVMEIARQALPAALEAQEAINEVRVPQAAHRVLIDCVTLGYMCVQTHHAPDRWELRPVWDFFGRRHFRYYDAWEEEWNERYENNLLTSWLTIDAVDGTVLER